MCRREATVADLMRSIILNDIITNARTDDRRFCDECKQHADLDKCDHCNRYVCSNCLNSHIEEVRLPVQ